MDIGQRRNRAQLSCTHCRHSKLKCDRKEPCSQCVKKGRALLCSFPSPAARRKPAVSMQNRLRHLESLVKDVMTGQSTPPGDMSYRSSSASSNVAGGHVDAARSDASPLGNPANGEISGHLPSSGQVLIEANESTYVGATHWAAILENIEEVKSYFQHSEDEDLENDEGVRSYATLTFNAESTTSKSELVAALPERSVVDRLVSRYFNSNSPALHIIHKPTFQKEYQRFWADPESTLVSWLGFLYAIMVVASFSAVVGGEQHPDSRGPVREMIQSYRGCCVQCLVLSNFTKPGPYTIESLVIYMEGEFVFSKDNQVHFYLLVGNAIRLALRMGLHRDATKVQSRISVYQAEMRRRLWNHLVQIDLLSSFHIGLPGMCQSIESDTLLPRNLRDEDFGEDSTTLPESRPVSELTPVSYSIFKGMFCKMSGKIATLANRLELPKYYEVIDLDRQLHEAYLRVPSFLLQISPDLSITESSDIIIKRLSIALIFQKSRCMLHRKFLMKAKECEEFKYSKEAGLDASLELLRFQALIHEAALPGGPLCRDRWFLSSLSMHDFLLAGMIVYLCLIQTFDKPISGRKPESLDQQQHRMITTLKRSYEIWNQQESISIETKKASGVLGILLKKLNIHPDQTTDAGSEIRTNTLGKMRNDGTFITGLSLTDPPPSTLKSTRTANTQESWPTESPHVRGPPTLGFSDDLDSASLPVDSIGAAIGFPDNFDWEMFDSQLLPQQLTGISWDTFDPEDLLVGTEANYNL